MNALSVGALLGLVGLGLGFIVGGRGSWHLFVGGLLLIVAAMLFAVTWP